MLTAAIARVILKKDLKQFDEAEKEIESASLSITGIDIKLVKLFSSPDLIKLIKSSDVFAGKCIATAELLYEYGKLNELMNNNDDSTDCFAKSLHLYLEAVVSDEIPDNAPYYAKIEELLSDLKNRIFFNELNLILLDYFLKTGQYSKLEDKAFEIIETSSGDTDLKILKYFERLNNLPENELASGNLSKEEVEVSIEEIRYLINQKSNEL